MCMRAAAMSRCLLATVFIAWLAGCAERTAGPLGQVVFVDAAGNRMVVDDSRPPAPGVNRMQAIPGVEPGLPLPVREVAEPPPDDADFLPVEEFEKRMEEKAGQRFFLLPDGQGGYEGVSASTLAAGDPVPPAGSGKTPAPVMLACRPGHPALEHLWLLDEGGRSHNLEFPVRDPTLKTRQRYAGYRVPIPEDTREIRMTGIFRDGASPDVVALQAEAMVPLAVVNNYATESVPENLFRYAMVVGVMPVLGEGRAVRELVVLEGGWARQVLDRSCRPAQGPHKSVAGKVAIEFLRSGGRTAAGTNQPAATAGQP